MLVIGVALAALSFVAVLALGFGQQPAQPVTVPDVPVVVAAVDLPLGTQITADKLTTVTKSEADAGDTFRAPEDITGKVVRQAVAQGTALTQADFDTSVTLPELVRTLPPGLRAIAVPLSNVDAVGGLLQSGDYVDVLISMEDLDGLNPISIPNRATTGTDGQAPAPYLSIDEFVSNSTVKVVLQNVQVLAAIPRPPTEETNVISQGVPTPDNIVLLSVSAQQAEVVRFAQLDGHVSLVLRSAADSGAAAVDTTGITLKQLVDQYGVLPPAPISPATP
jgi:pilus assembly protein CpaB